MQETGLINGVIYTKSKLVMENEYHDNKVQVLSKPKYMIVDKTSSHWYLVLDFNNCL